MTPWGFANCATLTRFAGQGAVVRLSAAQAPVHKKEWP